MSDIVTGSETLEMGASNLLVERLSVIAKLVISEESSVVGPSMPLRVM